MKTKQQTVNRSLPDVAAAGAPVDVTARLRELMEYRAKLEAEMISTDARIDEIGKLLGIVPAEKGGAANEKAITSKQ